ncbi:hypothetical protein JCM19046_4458 [Bacillus sp. JCM 19046]|nr:hypothetical protein JCM19046_4458 [Bacillus sp. JCM 19046]
MPRPSRQQIMLTIVLVLFMCLIFTLLTGEGIWGFFYYLFIITTAITLVYFIEFLRKRRKKRHFRKKESNKAKKE